MKKSDGKFLFSVIVTLALSLVLVVFALRNSDVVRVDLFFSSVEVSLALLIVVSALIGSVIVGSVLFIKTATISSQNKKLSKSLKEKEDLITKLNAKLSVVESERRTLERNEK